MKNLTSFKMEKSQSIINLKIRELELFKKTKFNPGSNTVSKRIINAKLNVLKEILSEILK